jgi:hypothetical protein
MNDPLFDRRRIGKFLVSIEVIENGVLPSVMKDLGITIIRAESMYLNNSIEYIGVCPSFDIIHDGEFPPEYIIIARNNEGVITYDVKRVGL